jgi:putative salt-induced outer membrane protein YdiY
MSGFILKAIAALAIVGVWSGDAAAQIHNVQSILATEAEEGLSGSVTASADWRTGNVAYLFLSASPVARYRKGKHLGIALAKIDHKTSPDTTIISRFFEHVRYRYQISDRWLGELFAQHTFDQVRRLEIRTLLGGGPKVDLLKGDNYGLGLGVAYMLEFERIKRDMIADAGNTDLAHRGSSYLVGHYELDERVQVVETIYVQPKLTRFSDTRVLNESRLTTKLGSRLAFSTAFVLAYDTHPPLEIKRLDTALTSSITLEL